MEYYTTEEMLRIQAAWKALDDKFGTDITVLDIHDISTVADCFIIAGGGNASHIKAMADEVELRLGNLGLMLHHAEGLRTMNWVLLDFGSIIVHIFDKESRNFYKLERVWGDAKIIPQSMLEMA
ncbi:MAG: ribosome silencing factor [Clostridiales bacterium]|jgi:ribosome-associated protein|nr:ribosome silencing factor [Clostridiales bacterium]